MNRFVPGLLNIIFLLQGREDGTPAVDMAEHVLFMQMVSDLISGITSEEDQVTMWKKIIESCW